MASTLLLSNKIPLHRFQPSNRLSSNSNPRNLESISCFGTHLRHGISDKLHLKEVLFSGQSVCSYRLKAISSFSSEDGHPISQEPVQPEKNKSYEQWDSMTAKFAGAANLPFLLLQLPQIVLNTQNLLAGNKSALLAVPWLLAMGEAMPLPHFIVTSIVVTSGLILNFMKYFNLLNPEIWHFWEDFITIAGHVVNFHPLCPNTVLPGLIAFVTAVFAVLMGRMGKLSDKGVKFLGLVSGWTATLLFMWMAVAQMWTNLLNPDNIKGLSAVSMLLAMIGNGLMIPRALFIRDFMWFTGSCWGSLFYGWGNLICLYWTDIMERHTSSWAHFTLHFFEAAGFRTLIIGSVNGH
ncbi:UNVERIFIED_CONTAM: Maltose excess protein 1-like, chloroplastic [Sesamum radiatum]|uniref:Maltose excess protein 1-like, chloroplastic n=1 Tax=Sesamum radiatum TaxID=300843 RepID=A0AAW2QEE2_SESRA